MLEVHTGQHRRKHFLCQVSIEMSTFLVSCGHLMFAFILAIQGVVSYPGGAPLLACNTMFPSGHEASPRSTDPPYRIRVPVKAYTPGATVKVTLEATADYFKGVFIQAREVGCRVNYTRAVGVFQTTDYGLKTSHCFGTVHSAVTHSSNSKKRSVSVYWTAPTISSGHVIIRATVVKERHLFWMNVDSEVMVDLESMDTPTCLQSTINFVPDSHKNVPSDTGLIAQLPATSASRSSSYDVMSVLMIILLLFCWGCF